MKKKEKLLIAGGDIRQIYCGLRLADRYDTAYIGFDKKYTSLFGDIRAASEEEQFDYAVLPVPPLDGEDINSPCSEAELSVNSIKKLLKPGGIILAGQVKNNLRELFPEYEIIDYMQREELNLYNAIPSAEGAVQIALEELPVTLNGLSVLIVGCGRIGSALIGILRGFGAEVSVAVRNSQGAAKAKLLGAKTCCTNNIFTKADLVFNTVPDMIFDRGKLSLFSQNTLFIDLASKPGGIDFDAAAELGYKAIWALGLPGKTAPITAGEIIADTINGILTERGEACG